MQEDDANADPIHGSQAIIEPVQVNSARVLLAGTIAWALALLVLLARWSWVRAHHHQQWLWTCVVGMLLGGAGLLLSRRHRSAGRTR